ncbi:L,D-transpeptidase [Nocardioides cynanchi]|uniref:L,D-transpeptidase n=1 Tax=Nocardioides cynanchi TaxID=2558918 RepID=UPI00124858C2|nr:L,D-transpeptidase [Nocardioides cynanchi]
MTGHRGSTRPRYGRIAALGSAVVVTALTGLAGMGILGGGGTTALADPVARQASYQQSRPTVPTPSATAPAPSTSTGPTGTDTTPLGPTTSGGRSDATTQAPLPAASGSGRRIVFSQHLQRVWLVGAHDTTRRTYLASGSLTDNLQPGHYAVTQRERHAIGIDDSGTMQYFVVFTAGPTGAAIGFHSIPVKDGHLVQTVSQLGTPQSHGCIRQWKPDAVALWHFAPVGTRVVVVA